MPTNDYSFWVTGPSNRNNHNKKRGFKTPGMVMPAAFALAENPISSDAGNTCAFGAAVAKTQGIKT